MLLPGQSLHARLVAQDGAARQAAAGVDRQNGHPVALRDQVQTQRLDEAALAHAGHAAQAQAHRAAAVRQASRQQRVGLGAVGQQAAFQQRDGLGQRPAAGGAGLAQGVHTHRAGSQR